MAPTLQDLISRHEADPAEPNTRAELAEALGVVGPVESDDGRVYLLAVDGTVRRFDRRDVRRARDVAWPVEAGAT